MIVTVDVPDEYADEINFGMSGRALEHQKKTAVTAALVEAAAAIKTLQDAAKETERVNSEQFDRMREYVTQIEGLRKTNHDQSEKLKQAVETEKQNAILQTEFSEASQYIQGLHEALEDVFGETVQGTMSPKMRTLYNVWKMIPKPPVIVPVPPAPPVVPVTPKDAVFPFCGGYFEDDAGSVDNPTQAAARANVLIPHMEFAAETNPAMDDYIFFANIEDIKHKRLMDTVKRLKKRAWLSPAQAYYNVGEASQPECIDHLKAAHSAGFYGAIVDDAHNIPAKDMVALITLINTYMPGAPVICSFGATFDDKAKGYPVTKYIDARQWFLSKSEDEDNYFAPWDKAFTCDIYMGDAYRRGSKTGYIHAPEKVVSMFREALPLVNGVGFYTVRNDETDQRADHLKAKQANPKAFTVWDAIVQCSNEYVAEYAKRTVKV